MGFGEMLVSTGTSAWAGLTVNVAAFDVPPAGAGLKTVMLTVPWPIRSVASICAVNMVGLTKVVRRGVPSKRTTEAPLMKPVPITVMVNPRSPSLFSVGLILVIVGTGLFPMMVNVVAADVPPPPPVAEGCVKTVTWTDFAIPPVSRSDAGIEAVNCVALSKCVWRADPSRRTTESGENLSPIALSMNAPLAFSLLVGSMLVNTGMGLGPETVTVPVFVQVEIVPEMLRMRLLLVSVKMISPFRPRVILTVSGAVALLIALRTSLGGAVLSRPPDAAPPSPSKPGGPPATTEFEPVDAIRTTRWLPVGTPGCAGGVPVIAYAIPLGPPTTSRTLARFPPGTPKFAN